MGLEWGGGQVARRRGDRQAGLVASPGVSPGGLHLGASGARRVPWFLGPGGRLPARGDIWAALGQAALSKHRMKWGGWHKEWSLQMADGCFQLASLEEHRKGS